MAVEVDGHRYAFLAGDVLEVVHMVRVAALPGAPAVIDGVIDLRGSVVPVLDLRSHFRHRRRPPTLDDRLVVVNDRGRQLALRVDRAIEVASVAPEHLHQVASLAVESRYSSGIARLPDGLAVICDLSAFLAADALHRMQDALAEAGEGNGLPE